MKEPHDDDLVVMVAVTDRNHVSFGGVTRKWANEIMTSWWRLHEVLREKGSDESSPFTDEEKAIARCSLTTGALAVNYAAEDWQEGDQTWCRAVVPWKEVVGLYVREIDKEEWRGD